MINFRVLPSDEGLDLCWPFFEAHWKEVAMYTDKIKLNINREAYRDAHFVVAFDKDRVIGYFVSFIQYHPHYQDTLWALNDVMYLSDSYRGRGIADDMMKFAEDCYRDIGVRVSIVSMKVYAAFDKLLLRQNYEPVERLYQKYLPPLKPEVKHEEGVHEEQAGDQAPVFNV